MARYLSFTRVILAALLRLAPVATAVVRVQPSKRGADVKVSSGQKKLTDKAFTCRMNREDISGSRGLRDHAGGAPCLYSAGDDGSG